MLCGCQGGTLCDNRKHEIFQAVALVSLVSHFHVLDQLVVDLFQYCASLIWSKCKLDWILKLRFLKNRCEMAALIYFVLLHS